MLFIVINIIHEDLHKILIDSDRIRRVKKYFSEVVAAAAVTADDDK